MDSLNKQWENWTKIIFNYNQPKALRSWWQIANSVIPYLAIGVIMFYSLNYSYWYTIGLSVLAAGFLTRIFIIFHDCGHGAFFKSQLLSKVVGIIAGALVFTPYHKWHYQHMLHHQTVSNLDKRGAGDVMTLTVAEFKESSKGKQFFYRLYRNPIILLLIAPIILFVVAYRVPNRNLSKKHKLYTHLTTLGLVLFVVTLSLLIGWRAYLLIQLPILYFATVFGVWLFYVQHQFEDVVWEREEDWDYKTVAMQGSSYLKYPKILQWFSGNIGLHHLHHLSPRIPNYNLEKCLKENPIFQKEPITFWQSFKSVKFALWDEDKRKLVSFREALA